MQNVLISFATKHDNLFLIENTQLSHKTLNQKLLNNEILVAKSDRKSIGLLILDFLWNHIPFISFIWVDEKYRRLGVGKVLLIFLENYLIENNNEQLISSSMENAKDARAWHQHMGFKVCGTIAEINDDNTGEVFFKKSLKRNIQSIT
ncbi:MAG: GNAT family N-acetyltransferase [Candidatus Marinimicrobia bacterium]|nr:GNAT family N-acetyltransferase [Candidatus Neomarinimicrobiota bacterium]